jgi:hypothetical protein
LYFDVANALPNDAVIDSVRLTLNMSRTASGTTTITIHPVTSAWGEGTSDASAEEGQGAAPTPDDATWIHSFFDTAFWQSPGGDFRANASAQPK